MPYPYEAESVFHTDELDSDLVAFIYDTDESDLAPYLAYATEEAA